MPALTQKQTQDPQVQIKASAYARFSDEKSASIEVQLYKITEYCVQAGFDLDEKNIFIDEAETGTNTGRRGFASLVAAAHRGVFDCVVIYDLTRGSRDVADWFAFRKEMQKLGVKVVSVCETLGDISDPSAFLSELMTVGIGQHHVLTTRKKTMDKIAWLAQQGKFCGGVPPLGYDIENGNYIINEHEAIAVRQIFGIYASGGSYSEIVEWCKKNGYYGKRGKPIGKNSLYSILRNERYIGRYTWNKRQVKYMSQWAGGKLREDVVVIDDLIPPIVDKQMWGRVQLRMDNNQKNTENNSPKNRNYILTGLLHCAKCGGAYIGVTTTNKKGHEHKFYTCANKRRRRDCDAKNIPANEIEPLIVGIVRRALLDGDLLERTADIILGTGSTEAATHTALTKELAEIEVKLNNLVDALSNGFANDLVRTRMAEYQTQRAALQEKIKSIAPADPIDRKVLIEELRKDANCLQNKPEAIKSILQKYLLRIDVDDETITVQAVCDLGEGSTTSEKDIKKGGHANGVTANGCGGRI
ncbi:MAG: recombinase family protein [Oscillospiraceae bacterium]